MSFRRLVVSLVVVFPLTCLLSSLRAQDIGPPPSGPPAPVVAGGQTGEEGSLPPMRPEVNVGPPPAGPPPPWVPPPSGPFGSGFATGPQVPPPPPLPPPPVWLATPPPGWFLGLEADIVRPMMHDQGTSDHLDLDWTVAPRVVLGYVFDHLGSIQLSYRYLESEIGYDYSDEGGPVEDLHLIEHWIDLAYHSRPYLPCHDLALQWEAGVRTAYLRIHDEFSSDSFAQDWHESFWGAGPEVGGRLTWALGPSGWALFGDTSIGVLFGRTWGRSDTLQQNDPLSPPVGSSSSWGAGQTVVDWRGELGLSWALPARPWFRLDFGVRGEVFGWDQVTYSDVGPFLRCLLQF
jgi:hypothetical protein